MKRTFLALLPLVIAGAVALSGCSKATNSKTSSVNGPDSVAMKVKWMTGKKYAMRLELNQTTETKAPVQQQQPVTIKETVYLSQDFNISVPKQLDNGGWQLELEFVGQSLDVSQGQRKEISFDSLHDTPADSDNSTIIVLRKMVGARLRYLTDADGKVQQIEGYSDLVNRMPTPETQRRLKEMFGGEDIFKRYGSLAAMAPRTVKVGDNWTTKDQAVTPVGLMDVTAKNTFKNWEQHGNYKCMHIETVSKVVPDSASANGSVQLDKGNFSGETWFAPDLGMLVETIEHQTLSLKLPGREQAPKIDRTIRITLADLTDLEK